MKNFKKFLLVLSVAFVASLSFISCGSTKLLKNQAVLTKEPERMFWKISGTDVNGQPSNVYLLGTIHVADERLYPLEEKVVNAFLTSDRLFAELSYEDVAVNLQNEMQNMMPKALLPDGKVILDDLTEEQRMTLYETTGGQIASTLCGFEPWVLFSVVESLYMNNIGFKPEFGLDLNLYAVAAQNGKAVSGMDSLQTQLDVVTFGDYNIQIQMLRDVLDDIKKEDSKKFLAELYECYLNNDIEAFAKLSDENNESDEVKNSFYKDYHKKILNDRNEDWAKKICNFLNEGGSTFIFVGSAHLIGKDSVFEYLKKMGAF